MPSKKFMVGGYGSKEKGQSPACYSFLDAIASLDLGYESK